MKNSNLAVIVISYNNSSEINNFVKTLKTFNSVNHIVIVDNASNVSRINELEKLTNENNNVFLVKNTGNYGYGKGNNIGIKYVEKHFDDSFIMISNSDVTIDEPAILDCLNLLKLDNSVGIVAPRMISNGAYTPSYWKLPTVFTTFTNTFFYLSPILRKFHTKQQGKTKLKVDVVSGSLFLIRTETLKSVGYFDERTFLYGEENILALKLKRIGLNNYILLNDKFSHVHGEVINKKFSSIKKRYLIALKSNIIYLRDYMRVSDNIISFYKYIYKTNLFIFICLYWVKNKLKGEKYE